MCRFIFFWFAWAAAVYGTNQMQQASPVSVPHVGCIFTCKSYDHVDNGSHHVPTTFCRGTQDFVLPDNFDVSLVNADTTYLWFSNSKVIVKDNYTPLPYLQHLRYILIDNIFFAVTPRFPLNGFLIHNKNHIWELDLYSVNLSGLNKADFNGFVRLKHLTLFDCEITAISRDIFEELDLIPDAPALSGIFPHLETVNIQIHDMEQLDWAFLSPISRSLKILNLSFNKLRSVISTADSNSPVFLESIMHLDLRGNRLRTLPSFIYESLNLRSLTLFDFTSYPGLEQQFCEKNVGCTCCELYNFTMWYRSNVPEFSYPEIRLTCGGKDGTVHNGSFSPECGPADPPTRIPTTATPAPTRPQLTTPIINSTQSTKSYPPTVWTPAKPTMLTESNPPICWTPTKPTPQTDYLSTPKSNSQGNCKNIELLIVSVVSLCLMQMILF